MIQPRHSLFLLCLAVTGPLLQAQTLERLNGPFTLEIPFVPVALNDQLFFRAYDVEHGAELWVSDGTAGGGELFMDLEPGAQGSFPEIMGLIGDKMYFSKWNHDVNKREIWSSDGSIEGTGLFYSFGPDLELGTYHSFHELLGRYHFSVNYAQGQYQNWVTDGTVEGTYALEWPAGPDLFFLGEFNGQLIAVQGSHIGLSDGTPEGTVIFPDQVPGEGNLFLSRGVQMGGHFYFGGGDQGMSLYRTDGTSQGLELVKDLCPGCVSDGALIYWFMNPILWNDKIYFSAPHPAYGQELWVTDGTEQGTVVLKDIAPGWSSFPTNFTPLGDKMFFSAFTLQTGDAMWQTDGTTEGTTMVMEGGFHPLYSDGGRIYFGNNGALWRTDGTLEGTVTVAPQEANTADPLISTYGMYQMGDALYFNARFIDEVDEIWKLTPDNVGIYSLDAASGEWLAYPNPATTVIRLVGTGSTTYRILDQQGRVVLSGRSGTDGSVQVEQLVPGVYMLLDEQARRVSRFVKE